MCDDLTEIPFSKELRKLVVVNTHFPRKIYGPLTVRGKGRQLQINNSSDGGMCTANI